MHLGIRYSGNVWQGKCLANSQIKSSWQKRSGKWIDFGQKDIN